VGLAIFGEEVGESLARADREVAVVTSHGPVPRNSIWTENVMSPAWLRSPLMPTSVLPLLVTAR
jgi:hypothetical protein